MKPYIYADNAATTKLDIDAFEAMKQWLLEDYGNPSQPYAFSRNPKKAIAESREIIAECIGAQPEEIIFTSGGSESDNWAIKGSALADQQHRATITSEFEHHAVLNSCAAIERLGYPVAYMPPSSDGVILPETLERFISNDTRLVSVMFANNEIGSIQRIGELCKIAHSYGALFHTDAVQAVGHVDIDVKALGVDMLSSSAHKFNGPKGIGFLFKKRDTDIPPYIDGGAQESSLRAGTENVAAIVGMATALKKNCDIIAENKTHLISLEDMLLEMLRSANVSFVRNGGNNTLPGLLSLSFPNAEGEAILHRMDLAGISISTGSACDSKNTNISHVLKAIQLDDRLAIGTIRISLGKYNTTSDVENIAKALIKICNRK